MMRVIDCPTFQFWWEDRNDPALEADFQAALSAHQASCGACAQFAFRSNHQRRALHAIPPRLVPVNLAVNLRVLASKERTRRAHHFTWRTRLAELRRRLDLSLTNLWKPIALPMAGGVASACLLFSAVMPTFAVHANSQADVPTAWFQQAELNNLGPFAVSADQVTLDVRIDATGRVIDYTVPSTESAWFKNKELRRAVENSLLFMSFKPANFFGQPTSDTIRITIQRSHIEVKG